MASEWATTTVGGLCDSFGGRLQTGPFGSQLHAEDYVANGPVPVVTTSSVGKRRLDGTGVPRISRQKADSLGRHYLQAGDIVFARRGVQAAGLSALVEPQHDGWLGGTGIIRLRLPATAVDAAFLSFVLSTERTYDWIRQHAIGATMPNLNEGVVRGVPVTLPPLDEQRRIAAVLGALDDKIELNRKMNQTLEQMAQAIFKSWFIDFDGHDPADMVESELGLIPTGWRVARLAELTSVLNRGISPSYVESGGVLVLNQKCVRGQAVSLSPARRHDPTRRSVDGREIQAGDVLVNSTGVGTLGRVAMVPDLPETAIVDSHVTVVRAAIDRVQPLYLGVALCLREAEIAGLGEGSTGQTELSRTRLGQLSVLVPPQADQARFVESAAPLRARIEMNERQGVTLTTLRDTLLPKLISGEIRVPDAEATIAAAT